MRLLGIDLETTGLDFEKDQILEIGYVIKDHGAKRAHRVVSEYIANVIPEGSYTGHLITVDHLNYAELLSNFIREMLHAAHELNVQAIVAHNGEGFDKPFLLGKLKAAGLMDEWQALTDMLWLDTKEDIEWEFKSSHLNYLAAENGFLNPFPHAALFDVMTMLKLLDGQDLQKVVQRNRSPSVVLRAMVSFDDKDKAKQRRYNWQQVGDKVYPKCWVKKIKECDLSKHTTDKDGALVDKELGFPVVRLS